MLNLEKGKLLIEGKTKSVFELIGENTSKDKFVLIENKDKITAFDGGRSDDLEDKADISNDTNAKVFGFLNKAGFRTAFMRKEGKKSYVARKCHMIPLEWVTRRIATGSFLKRNPGVNEGYKFTPVKLETFLKDDANKDPQWSEEQILSKEMEIGGVKITKLEYDIMANTTVAIFEVLERAWASIDCTLVDMKIEFGIDATSREILLSDVIDSDSWRLWPSGDKRLMKDKQVYRNLKEVTPEALNEVKRNFQWVAKKLDLFTSDSTALVVIIMGSPSDKTRCEIIQEQCHKLGLKVEMRISSAHKETADTLNVVSEYEGMGIPVVFIAVAGRSNGLGPVISGNTAFPVINCPPLKETEIERDIWSSLSTPSGLGCCTVIHPEAAAQHAASILALNDHSIWAKMRVKRLNIWKDLRKADAYLRN
ncbi:Multifunctional protein ADE2 [Armadillidium vulgare]|nr:Multifunctional protein ADE2 [Armadillidium vulgare]